MSEYGDDVDCYFFNDLTEDNIFNIEGLWVQEDNALSSNCFGSNYFGDDIEEKSELINYYPNKEKVLFLEVSPQGSPEIKHICSPPSPSIEHSDLIEVNSAPETQFLNLFSNFIPVTDNSRGALNCNNNEPQHLFLHSPTINLSNNTTNNSSNNSNNNNSNNNNNNNNSTDESRYSTFGSVLHSPTVRNLLTTMTRKSSNSRDDDVDNQEFKQDKLRAQQQLIESSNLAPRSVHHQHQHHQHQQSKISNKIQPENDDSICHSHKRIKLDQQSEMTTHSQYEAFISHPIKNDTEIANPLDPFCYSQSAFIEPVQIQEEEIEIFDVSKPKTLKLKNRSGLTPRCSAYNQKKRSQCLNPALMDANMQTFYCAEHIELDPTASVHKCGFEISQVPSKKCKEIVQNEFKYCHKHIQYWLNQDFVGPDAVNRTTRLLEVATKTVQSLQQEARQAKTTDIALYQRKSKVIPKYHIVVEIIQTHLTSLR